jgi:hypothetical protein
MSWRDFLSGLAAGAAVAFAIAAFIVAVFLAVLSREFQLLLDCVRRCMEAEQKSGTTLTGQDLFYHCLEKCSTVATESGGRKRRIWVIGRAIRRVLGDYTPPPAK